MTTSVQIPDDDGRRVLQLFEEVLTILPAGVATVEARRTLDGKATVVTLKPTNTNSVSLSAVVEDGLGKFTDVSLGELTTLELPWEARLPSNASFDLVLAEVKKICLAVIAGRCEHRFGFLGIRGAVYVGEEEYGSTHFFHPRLYPKVVRYEPYFPVDRQ